MMIVNIYAPYDLVGKKALWDDLAGFAFVSIFYFQYI